MNRNLPFDPATEPYVNLATYRRNGVEVRTPVWIAGAQGRYYVFSAGDAGKVKRIRATWRVRLAACNFKGEIKSDWIEGEGRILDEGAIALRALRAKYGLQMRLTDFFAKVSGRFRKRAYIEITLGRAIVGDRGAVRVGRDLEVDQDRRSSSVHDSSG